MSHKVWAVVYAASVAALMAVIFVTIHHSSKTAPPLAERVVCKTALGSMVSAPAKHWSMDAGRYWHARVVFVPPEGSECGVISVAEPNT